MTAQLVRARSSGRDTPRVGYSPVVFTWSQTDHWTVVFLLALGGSIAGAAMALLGLPRIGWHGPLYRLGYMSPTCGLTRGVQHMFQGDVFTAALFNPAAPVLVLGAAAAILRWIVGRTTGHWLGFEVEHSHRAVRAAFLATIATLFILLWINQQLNAGFLLTH